MRRATITLPPEIDAALEDFRAQQPAKPSVTSVVEAALTQYLLNRDTGASSGSAAAELLRHRPQLRRIAHERGIRSLYVFGSAARGEDGPESDIDFLVEVNPGVSLFDLAHIANEFEALLGRRIDIVTLGGLDESEREAALESALAL